MADYLVGKSRFYTDGNNELYMDKGFASLVFAYVEDDDEKLIEVAKLIRACRFDTLAERIATATMLSEDDIYDYISTDQRSVVYLQRNGVVYRMVIVGYYLDDNDIDTFIFNPVSDPNKKRLRQEARENIRGTLRARMGDKYIENTNVGVNVYRYGFTLLAETDTDYLYDVVNGQAPAAPEKADEGFDTPQKQDGQPVVVEQQVVERVIEREKPAVLEGLLQEAVTQLIAKVAVDDMVPRIKENIIEEFGIEPVKHIVVDVTGEEREIPGVVHEAFDAVCHFVKNDVPVMLYGPSGSGKGYLLEQVAEALGLDYFFMNSVTEEYKINGFVDVNGNYHESEFYKAFTQGGLFFLDEIDASAPEVLVCLNAAIANRYFTFPNGFKKAHENFRVVAAGNTLGTGADASYTGRMQLDAASLNRFVVVPVGYDQNIDRLSADGDEELVEFATVYRAAAQKCGLATICSYRNLQQIKVSEVAMELEKALLYCLTKEMNQDDINVLYNEMSNYLTTANKYFNAFRNIKPMV